MDEETVHNLFTKIIARMDKLESRTTTQEINYYNIRKWDMERAQHHASFEDRKFFQDHVEFLDGLSPHPRVAGGLD